MDAYNIQNFVVIQKPEYRYVVKLHIHNQECIQDYAQGVAAANRGPEARGPNAPPIKNQKVCGFEPLFFSWVLVYLLLFLFYYLILSFFTAQGGASAPVPPPPLDTSLYIHNTHIKFQCNFFIFCCAMVKKGKGDDVTFENVKNKMFLAFLIVVLKNKVHFWNPKTKLDEIGMFL